MKKQLPAFITGMLTAALIAGLSITALAATGQLTITVDPINVQVNGQVFAPKDVNGQDVPVFAYNGTTYAPLRALAEAYDLEVGYDAGTNMATVNKPLFPQGDIIPTAAPASAPTPKPTVAPIPTATPAPTPVPTTTPYQPSAYELRMEEYARHQSVIDGLNQQYSNYKDIISNKKSELRSQTTPYFGTQSSYESEKSKLLNEISTLSNRAFSLSLDDSRQGQMLYQQALSDQAKKQQELDELQESYSVKLQIEALDQELTNYKSAIDQKIADEDRLYQKNLIQIGG